MVSQSVVGQSVVGQSAAVYGRCVTAVVEVALGAWSGAVAVVVVVVVVVVAMIKQHTAQVNAVSEYP